ncbi:MAG: hypothetical protein AAF984_02535 [Verrucomicrobiota bacterium]
MDDLLAATAKQHELTIVTRNADDFVSSHVSPLNPFWYTPKVKDWKLSASG